jgi:hypothetical protein
LCVIKKPRRRGGHSPRLAAEPEIIIITNDILIYVLCIFIIQYYDQHVHTYLTNYHTPTCFDTIVSTSDSLQSIPSQVTPVFKMQLLVIQFIINMFHVSGFGGLVVTMLASGSRVRTRPKPSDFFGRKNLQHAFVRKGSKAVCPMSQICGM